MEFLANENFPLASIQHLREVGYRVISILQEAAGAKDEDILKRAHEESLLILTFDRDYGELLFRHQALPPAGVVYFRFSPASPLEPAEMLLKVMEEAGLSLVAKFTIVERGKVRQRSLRIHKR
jgi:predicted nuclease of predicted toxin-antitoxin system